MFRRLLAPMIVCMLSAGCGGSDGPELQGITGKVTFKGEPLKEGEIVFRKSDGDKKAYAGKITDGTFSLESESGPMQVEITSMQAIPGKFDTSNPGEKVPVVANVIPPQFNSKTKLTAEVSDEKTEFDFPLDY